MSDKTIKDRLGSDKSIWLWTSNPQGRNWFYEEYMRSREADKKINSYSLAQTKCKQAKPKS